MSRYDADGALYQTDWVTLTDSEAVNPMAEAVLIVNVNWIHLREGIKNH